MSDPLEDGGFIPNDEIPGGDMATVEERLAQLEKQVPLQTEGLRRVTEGHYTGADGSAAIVLALEGNDPPKPISPQPDPQ